MTIAAVHFFDLGLGRSIAYLALFAFIVSVGVGISRGLGFWGAVQQAPGGSGVIDIADNVVGLWNFYDAFCLKHMGIVATTEQWVIFRAYMAEKGQEIDEQKARCLYEDLMPAFDTDELRKKVGRNAISAEDFAIADRVAAQFPDIQGMANESARKVDQLLGGEDVSTQAS